MNSIQTSLGVLKYRNPTVLENMQLLKEAKEHFKNEDHLGAKIAIMGKVAPLLDFSEMENVNSFDDLNNLGDEMTLPVAQIADEIIIKLVGAFQKKS